MSQLTPQREGRYFTQHHLLEADIEIQLLCLLTWSGTEWLRLEDTSVGQLVQPQMLRQDQLSRRPRAPSRQFLSVSKDGDPTISLCNLYSDPSLTVKKNVY